jgi:hypothetical protein
MIDMKILTTFLAVLATANVYAQGIFWSANKWAEGSYGTPQGTPSEIAFDHVSEGVPYPPSANTATRIFCMTLVTNDTGRTFFANALNEPGFGGFVAGLTDGANGYLRFQDAVPQVWGSQTEQNFLGRSSLAPDLAGYSITQIGFRVNNFYEWYYAPDDIYFKRLDYSLDFYGVPEPSTYALLALGGAAALLMWRKACKLSPVPRK